MIRISRFSYSWNGYQYLAEMVSLNSGVVWFRNFLMKLHKAQYLYPEGLKSYYTLKFYSDSERNVQPVIERFPNILKLRLTWNREHFIYCLDRNFTQLHTTRSDDEETESQEKRGFSDRAQSKILMIILCLNRMINEFQGSSETYKSKRWRLFSSSIYTIFNQI